MPRAIGVVTVARSDWDYLVPVLEAIREAGLDLRLYVGGSHLSERFGSTVSVIEKAGWPIAARVEMLGSGDTPADMATAASRATAGLAAEFARHRPDLLVILGDRIEMLGAAVAALPFAIPIAHIHGGEVTEGAIDEQARHAITKLAHLHFTSAEPYAHRIRQMGEEPWRVHCVGAPSLDGLRLLVPLSRADLAAHLRLPLRRPTLLVTFHPVTLELADTARHVEELAAALASVEGDVVITYPGADAAHRTIVERWNALAAERPGTRLVPSLGFEVYGSLLREADVMVGNSSSGIIESEFVGLPVVNIGNRQKGRLRNRNVIDVGHARDEIAAGIASAVDPTFRRGLDGMPKIYGDGNAAPRIAAVLRDVDLAALPRKRFVDR